MPKDHLIHADSLAKKALGQFYSAIDGLKKANERLEAVKAEASAVINHHRGRHAAADAAQQQNRSVIAKIESLLQ